MTQDQYTPENNAVAQSYTTHYPSIYDTFLPNGSDRLTRGLMLRLTVWLRLDNEPRELFGFAGFASVVGRA
jgi:hypothetical protein